MTPAVGNGTPRVSTSANGPTENDAARWQPLPPIRDAGEAEPAANARLPAVNDAAILQWDDSLEQQLAMSTVPAPLPSPAATERAAAEDESQARQIAARLLSAKGHLLIPGLAAIALGGLVSHSVSRNVETRQPGLQRAGAGDSKGRKSKRPARSTTT